MKQAATRVPRQQQRPNRLVESVAGIIVLLTALAASADTTTQLLLSRDARLDGEYKGVVELTVDPGFENAKVAIQMDGQKVADALRAPYKVTIDFGATAIEHRISVTAWSPEKRRVQWRQTLNIGKLPLTVKLRAIDASKGQFEATATAPAEDPIAAVELWDNGQRIAEATAPPYRFEVAPMYVADGFVQATAKTKSGEEAADFWSSAGEVHVENVEVRTVPIFVSVVDANGATRDDVDPSIFRVLDNESETKILEVGRAFNQPISIALLIDASASMTYAMRDASRAAAAFVQRTLRDGDSCSVFAIRSVPRRMQELTKDKQQIAKAITGIDPQGQTALYDAITSAIRDLAGEKNRRAIVVLTDGGDTSSNASYEDVEKSAEAAGIPLYFIRYDTGGDDGTKDLDRLKFLAASTGGFVATATGQQNLMAKYTEIEKDLRAQFAIRYQVTDYKKRNEWRRIRVVLNARNLTARTIRGYFAP